MGANVLRKNQIPNTNTHILVASSTASDREKSCADYLCDGIGDQVEINSAITDILTTGGVVKLSSGTFNLASTINLKQSSESADNPYLALLGNGIDSTILNAGTNVNAITTGNSGKFQIADLTIALAGSGNGIYQAGGTERGNWQSIIRDIYIKSNFVDHTGWGIDMRSPFRMRFENIELNGVANGMNLQCHTESFNPGNISIDRMFIDLWDNASNSSAIGLKLAVTASDSTGVMNLVSINRLDIYGGSNLTNSIGISLVGSSSSYGDSRHHSFRSLNIEDIKTAIKCVRARDCSFNDMNYCRVLNGGTIIDLDSNSHNNLFDNLYAMGVSSGTYNLIVDNNTSNNLPNKLSRVDGYQPSGVTINATLAQSTILEQIDLSGGSPTIDNDITNRNNLRYQRIVQLKIVDESTALTTGDNQLVFCIPDSLNGMNLISAHAFVSTVSSSGTPTIQIRNVTDSQDMLSTAITIDAYEKTSYTATTAPVINGSYDDVATADIIAIDVDVAGTGAKGLGVILKFI